MREQVDNNSNVRWFMPDEISKKEEKTEEQMLAEAEARFKDGGYDRESNALVECCAKAGYEAMCAYLGYAMENSAAVGWSEQPETAKHKFRIWVEQIMQGNWHPSHADDLGGMVSARLFGQVVRSVLVAHARSCVHAKERIPGGSIAELAVARNVLGKKLPEDALFSEE